MTDHNGAPDALTPCECDESALLWMILSGDAPAPDTAGWRALGHLVEALALRKLAEIRPQLVASNLDAIIPNRFAQLEARRNTYSHAARTPEQIRRDARESWGLPA